MSAAIDGTVCITYADQWSVHGDAWAVATRVDASTASRGPEEREVSATIGDVARAAQVSVATVSRALRGLPNVAPATRARVFEAAEQLHYVADPHASRLAAGRTHTVGVVVPKIGQWYYARLFDAVTATVSPEGYDVLPFVLGDQASRRRFLARRPFRKRVDALVVVDVPMTDEQLSSMAEADVPIVTVGLRTEVFSSILVDHVGGARMAAEHLIGLGHDAIALLGTHHGDPGEPVPPLDRREGFLRAMAARDITARDDLMVDAEVSMSGGAAAAQALMQLDQRPTAMIALSDEMAIGAIQVARDYGMVIPDDISIVGFDDHDVSEFIGLTTVRQDVDAQGQEAAGWALEALAGGAGDHHVVLPTRLVVRRTTGPPKTRNSYRGR